MMRNVVLVTGLLLSVSQTSAFAQTPAMTVQSLMNDGHAVVGAVQSRAGLGVLLEKGNALFICFAAETPTSPTVATQYCKPVK